MGRVTSVVASGKITVHISDLNAKYGPLFPINATTPSSYAVNDVVVCTFTDEFFSELIVLGSAKVKEAAETVDVAALTAQIATLEEKIQALELGIWT
jgi:hypothetical protein